jgi:hypothetical protein
MPKTPCARIIDPAKRWKLPAAPWHVVDASSREEADEEQARLNLISHLLSQVTYGDLPHERITLPARQKRTYTRPPLDSPRWVDQRYVVR